MKKNKMIKIIKLFEKRNILPLFLVIGLLLFSSCGGGGSNNRSSGIDLGSSFNGGDSSLEFNFIEPPEKIFDGDMQNFILKLEIENKGEFDVSDGRITLSGINPADFSLDPSNISKALPELNGIKKQGDNTLPGTRQMVVFDGLKYVPSIANHNQKIFASICYPYQTKSLIKLCVSGNTLTYDDDNEICQLNGDKEFANSGAPVKIQNVKQNSLGEHQIGFQFDIVHVSKDSESRIYKLGTLDDNCKIEGNSITSADASLKENYIQYTVDTGIAGLNCGGTNSNTGSVQITDGGTTSVYCTQDTTGQEEFEKPITVTLEYDYFNRKSVEIQIQHFER